MPRQVKNSEEKVSQTLNSSDGSNSDYTGCVQNRRTSRNRNLGGGWGEPPSLSDLTRADSSPRDPNKMKYFEGIFRGHEKGREERRTITDRTRNWRSQDEWKELEKSC